MARMICTIAKEIQKAWPNVNHYAAPYLNAMLTLYSIESTYGADDARTIISYFLANASTFRVNLQCFQVNVRCIICLPMEMTMSTNEVKDTTGQDEHLLNLSKCLTDFSNVADTTRAYGLFSVGVKISEDQQTVETFANVVGNRDILFQGIYSELKAQIESGDKLLFSVLTDVLHHLHRDIGNVSEEDRGSTLN